MSQNRLIALIRDDKRLLKKWNRMDDAQKRAALEFAEGDERLMRLAIEESK